VTANDALWEAARSGDRAAALALADAIEDEDLAYAVRWCGARGKWPLLRTRTEEVDLQFPWCWFRAGRTVISPVMFRLRNPRAVLPALVYDVSIPREPRGSFSTWTGWIGYRKELHSLLWLARRLRVGRDVFEARW
jgi:hypothetical protein